MKCEYLLTLLLYSHNWFVSELVGKILQLGLYLNLQMIVNEYNAIARNSFIKYKKVELSKHFTILWIRERSMKCCT